MDNKEEDREPLQEDITEEMFVHPHHTGADTGKAELEELADLSHKGTRDHRDHQKAA